MTWQIFLGLQSLLKWKLWMCLAPNTSISCFCMNIMLRRREPRWLCLVRNDGRRGLFGMIESKVPLLYGGAIVVINDDQLERHATRPETADLLVGSLSNKACDVSLVKHALPKTQSFVSTDRNETDRSVNQSVIYIFFFALCLCGGDFFIVIVFGIGE